MTPNLNTFVLFGGHNRELQTIEQIILIAEEVLRRRKSATMKLSHLMFGGIESFCIAGLKNKNV
jgi:hypothetical protein